MVKDLCQQIASYIYIYEHQEEEYQSSIFRSSFQIVESLDDTVGEKSYSELQAEQTTERERERESQNETSSFFFQVIHYGWSIYPPP